MSDIKEVPRYTIPRDTFNDAFFPYLRSNARTEIFYGGGGSGKSYFLAQRDILDVLGKDENNVLIMSKVAASNHNTTFSDLCYVIDMWDRKYFNGTLSRQFKINHSKGDERILCLKTGNEILFGGCKDDNELEKVKGIRASNGPITHIRCEEMTNFTQRDFFQLNGVRLRGETKTRKRFTGSMNPILSTHWIKEDIIDKAPKDTLIYEHGNTNQKKLMANPDLVILKTTHEDNKFYGEEERAKLLQFEFIDKYYYDVYVLGNWGVLGNIVFSNYVIEDFGYTEYDLENIFTGMDYGFVHASTIERGGFKDGELYVFDELYGKKWTNQDFIDNAKQYFDKEIKQEEIEQINKPYNQQDEMRDFFSFNGAFNVNIKSNNDTTIYEIPINADSAEPDRIEEWNRNGFIVTPAKKGPGSLQYGIDYLCSIPKIHIHKTKCPNLAREITTFKRREDKDGNALPAFVELNDDTIAALRYGTESIWANQNQYINRNSSGFSLSDLGL